MNTAVRFSAALVSLGIFLVSVQAGDWPGWRGSGSGVAPDKNLPVELSKDNMLWKVKLPGPGTSSPIVYQNKIFLTCYTGYGTKITKGFSGGFGGGFGGGKDTGGDQKKLRLLVLCLDAKNGDVIWKKEIQPKLPEEKFSGFLREHGYASSTPVTDGERVYVFFGKTGVFAFDMDGKQLWQAGAGTGSHFWGSASSPVLYKDLLIVNAAIESKSLVALNKKTGEEVWRAKDQGTSWASPLVVKTKEGKEEVVVSIPGKVIAYDPDKGTELWHCQGIGAGSKFGGKGGFGGGGFGGKGGFGGGFGAYTISTPVAKDGIVYVIGGGGPTRPAALAVKAGGKGDVTKSHVLWRKDTGSSTCSPVLVGDNLCWVSGFATCVNTEDGKTTANERLYNSKGEYVSAVAAGDTVYALTRFDGLYVFSLGSKEIKKMDHFEFQGDDSIFNASPAISNGKLFLRSNEYLYCIGKK